MAEEEGFEPPKDLRPCLISSQVVSTTHPLLLKLRGLLQKIGAENSSRKSGQELGQGCVQGLRPAHAGRRQRRAEHCGPPGFPLRLIASRASMKVRNSTEPTGLVPFPESGFRKVFRSQEPGVRIDRGIQESGVRSQHDTRLDDFGFRICSAFFLLPSDSAVS